MIVTCKNAKLRNGVVKFFIAWSLHWMIDQGNLLFYVFKLFAFLKRRSDRPSNRLQNADITWAASSQQGIQGLPIQWNPPSGKITVLQKRKDVIIVWIVDVCDIQLFKSTLSRPRTWQRRKANINTELSSLDKHFFPKWNNQSKYRFP